MVGRCLRILADADGGGVNDNANTTVNIDGKPSIGGDISPQSESHPIDFRKVELLNLAGCTDRRRSNPTIHHAKHVPRTGRPPKALSLPSADRVNTPGGLFSWHSKASLRPA